MTSDSSIPTSKRVGGRPPIPAEDRLDARVLIRLNPSDSDSLNGAAMRERLTKAAYIRRILHRSFNDHPAA